MIFPQTTENAYSIEYFIIFIIVKQCCMERIISPVPRKDLEKELTRDKFVRQTNNGNNEVYIFTHLDSPMLMREVGRLREFTFRTAGGGTGKEIDIDRYDTSEDPYKQLIVWDPKEQEILGGYRMYFCRESKNICNGINRLATSSLFHFSEKFIADYFPHLVELGRSFVQPAYQSTSGSKKGLFALDNLWDGLGALLIDNPGIRYFFGKVTMYPQFNKDGRDLILYFLEKHFKDLENLVVPIEPLQLDWDIEELKSIFSGETFLDDYKILSQKVRAKGENIPPLINAYMNLSPTMKTFGTVISKDFGFVQETGIMLTLKDLYISKVNRHLASYRKDYKLPSDY